MATFPLDSTRRHVAKGPLTDWLVKEAATAYGELLRERAAEGDSVLHLVPTGLAAGALDRVLREEILAVLPGVELVRGVDGVALRPRDAVVVEGADEAFNRLLAPMVPGLIAARREDRLALDALQVRRLELAEVVDQLGGRNRPTGGATSTRRSAAWSPTR